MPQVSGFEQKLRSIRETFQQGSLETQDSAINELHNALEDASDSLFPSLFYPPCINVLSYYCQALLPHLSMSPEDRQCIQRAFECTIDRLHTQEQHARDLETHINRFLLQVRGGQFNSAADLVTAFASVIRTAQNFRQAHVPSYDSSEDEMFPVKELEKQYRTLKKSPFTAKHVRPFFETVIHNAFSHQCKEQFEWMQSLFWHGLNDLLQMKAVLVNTLTQEALITRLDVETRLESAGLDELDFENRVDERMYLSCWNAVQAARDFLETHFPDILKDHSLRVLCWFPNPAAEYNDASASLLVGLKVVGDVLDMQSDPQVVVSGEVDETGRILPVNHVAAKLRAAEQHPAIQQLYLPQNETYLVSKQVAIVTASIFSDAIYDYYGEQLQKKMRLQVSRRQILGFAGFVIVPSIFSVFKNLFVTSENPVTECDWRLLECAREAYQKRSEYQTAITILKTLFEQFRQDNSITNTVRFKAFALGQLGVIYLQQHRIEESLRTFRRAIELWHSIHDRENLADVLLRLGEVYRYTVAMDEIKRNSKIGLDYYQQANELLTPSMQGFSKLRGRACSLTGYLYYWVDEYDLAKKYCEKGVKIIEGPETNWTYQASKQHFGRVLVRIGEYDNAYDILQSTSQSLVLQGPHDRVRSFWSLSDLFFSIGEHEKGVEFASKAKQLCKDFGLKGQYRILANMLARHKLSSINAD